MNVGTGVLATLLLASAAFADSTAPAGNEAFSIRPLVGAYIPSGAQHRELSSSVVTGSEVAYALNAPIRLVGAVTWTPSRERSFSNARSSIIQYDAGAELIPRRSADTPWQLSPFLGAGLGGRSYRLRSGTTPSQSDFAGYGALGAELERGGVGARIEVRDYVSRFKLLPGTGTTTRDDLMLTAALSIHV